MLRFRVLHLGKIDCQRLHLVACEDEATMIRSPMFALLLQHPQLGNYLYDTGNTPFYNSIYPESVLATYPITEFVSIETALAACNLSVGDIDGIILSHLHFDHAGGLQYFSGTPALQNVIVAEAELKHAYHSVMTGQAGAYVKSLFDLPDICFTTINEDTTLAEGLHLFLQAAHTPAVIGLRLDLEQEGCVLVTGDTIYTEDSYRQALPPGGSINKTPEEFFENLAYIQNLEQTHQASILFGHDFAQAQTYATRGWID